jgi:hypothetical protein
MEYQSIMYHQPFVIENFFSNINNKIQRYFSPRIVKEIHKQMCELVLYRCEKLNIEDAFNFNEDQVVRKLEHNLLHHSNKVAKICQL